MENPFALPSFLLMIVCCMLLLAFAPEPAAATPSADAASHVVASGDLAEVHGTEVHGTQSFAATPSVDTHVLDRSISAHMLPGVSHASNLPRLHFQPAHTSKTYEHNAGSGMRELHSGVPIPARRTLFL